MTKKLIISGIILLTSTVLWAQDSLVIEKYNVSDFYINDKLVENRSDGQYISFVQKNNSTYFINGFENSGTYSIGEISDLESSDGSYEKDGEKNTASRSEFLWHYKNSYDNASGVAEVRITKIFFDKYMSYDMFIYTDTKDTLSLYGVAKYTIPEDEFIQPIKGAWLTETPISFDKTSIEFFYMYDTDYHRYKDSLWTTNGCIYTNWDTENIKILEETTFDYYIDSGNISIIVTYSNVGVPSLSQHNFTYKYIDQNTLELEYKGQHAIFKKEL